MTNPSALPRMFLKIAFLLVTLTLVALSAPMARAQGRIPAFAQAVAEAAARDEDIAAFYRQTAYAPLWTGTGEQFTARREALLSAILNAPDHGLPASAYDTGALEAELSDVESQRALGRVEVEMSKLFLTYARQIQTGVLTPHDVDAGIKREVKLTPRTELLSSFAAAAQPSVYLRLLQPTSPEYARLMKEKLRLEALIARGGWGPKVAASSLKPGQTGNAVIALRNRLIAMGYLSRSATRVYDAQIQSAVQAFQLDHGLNTDGVAGAGTIEAINVPARERLGSILVAMERERWMNGIERGKRHVWVNLTSFEVAVVDDGKVTHQTRVVIGKNTSDRRSPEFSDMMEHLIVNPNWNVPRSIAVKEYLPGMIASGGGSAGHLQLIDGRGRVVSRSSVDWTNVSASRFPFDLRQPAGSGNALGLVKFMFPNPYNVYLHDTPSKYLFSRDKRDFSHGCIRVQNPFELAYVLLAPQSEDPKATFHAALNTHQRTQINLETPIPVHLVYRTAIVPAKGRANYRNDVYGRDARILAALLKAGVELPAPSS